VAAKTALGELIGGAAKMTQMGLVEAAAKKIVPAAGETLASKIGTAAAKGAIENMLIAGSDEVSRMILEDPHQSAETAISIIGLSGALGGVLGGSLGAVSPLWKATIGDKASKLAADFRGRILEHVNNPDPVHAVTRELTDYFSQVNKIGSEIYGEAGLKTEAIQHVLPKLDGPMLEQLSEIRNKLQSAVSRLENKNDPYANVLADKIEEFTAKIISEDAATGTVAMADSAKLFDSVQSLKRWLQAESKYDRGLPPLAERAYINTTKELAHDLRVALEDPKVWGEAGKLQQKINSAFTTWLKATKDFRGLMTTEVMGERAINPAKVQTYINQLGKAQAEIKTTKMENFLKATEDFKKAVNVAYDKLDAKSPLADTPLNVTLSTLNKKTLGAKIADAFIDKALTDVGGKGLGALVGAGAGASIGLGKEVGALLGAASLGPFFSSVLPAIAKSIVTNEPNPTGFKAAVDYAVLAAKGDNLLGKAAQNVFKAEREVLPASMHPDEKSRLRLNKALVKLRDNPSLQMPHESSDMSHYLVDHNDAMAQASATAAAYINSLRTIGDQKAPLDMPSVPNDPQLAKFNRALGLAEQPLLILDKIKKGTLTAEDVAMVSQMYPALTNRIKSRLMAEMTDYVSKGQVIPYRTRLGLSLFLGQPLDSTLSPAAIQTMQAVNAVSTQRQAQQQAMPSAPKGTPSSPALQKMPNLYQTPAQAKELHRSRR
jgi:hypothetical protein